MLLSTYTGLLQTLGIAIINSLWQAAVVWLGYIIINIFLKLSSSKKYLFSVISELIIFLWFIISFISNLLSPGYFYSTKIFTQTTFSPIDKTWINSTTLAIISFIYLIILAGMMAKWTVNFYNIQKTYRHNLISFETQLNQWIEEKAKQLNIKKNIKIFVTNYIYVPLTIGVFKPIILLPAAIKNYLTVEELEAILLHELAHIKRADYLINILLSLVETVLYFNPFIFYFRKIIKKERENICDDEVLIHHYTPVQYAESLLKLAKFSLNKKQIAFAMSAANNHRQLLQRIQRITQTKVRHKNNFSFIISFSLLIISFTTFGLLYIPSHSPSVNSREKIAQTKLSSSTMIVSSAPEKNTGVENIIPLPSRKRKQKISVRIEEKKTDETLNLAVENLKQMTIPGLQNNIEEYRKSLSGADAQQLADNSLKQKIKNYVSSKNISINDFINKIDSIKINQETTIASNNNNFIIPASYIEKDSLNRYIQQHKQIKHFVVVPNNNASPYYLVIHSLNENKEPLFIFIPYKPERSVD